MIFKSIIGAISVCATLLSFSANAVPSFTHDTAGQISGVLNLDVDGDLYNMTLHDGSFREAFEDEFPILDDALYTEQFSEESSNSLLTFLLSKEGDFLSEDFLGCTRQTCVIATVYEISTSSVLFAWGVNIESSIPRSSSPGRGLTSIDSQTVDITYASWELAASVPEPSIAILLGSGLIAFAVVRRKARA